MKIYTCKMLVIIDSMVKILAALQRGTHETPSRSTTADDIFDIMI